MNPFKTALLSGAVALMLAQPVAAQNFPNKPVRVITPFPGGSGPDAVARVVGDKLSRYWGQQVLVENRPGGNGVIAIEAAKKSPADGYTLLQVDDMHMGAQQHLFKRLPYDMVKDFEPVGSLFRTYFFVVVPASTSWKNVADLVNTAKASPDNLTYGSWFVGSPGHIGAVVLEGATGTRMVHVPYKDMNQLYASVGNNDVGWAFGTAGSAGALYRAGKVKFLAVAAPKRTAGFTDVPTLAEAGGPANMEVKSWVALLAPRGVPEPVVKRINDGIAKALAEQDLRERFAGFGFEPLASTPQEIVRMVEADSRKYGDVIKRANISLD
jgi:tripartite-type tricarboxylate transporter receptor subunit TctC